MTFGKREKADFEQGCFIKKEVEERGSSKKEKKKGVFFIFHPWRG